MSRFILCIVFIISSLAGFSQEKHFCITFKMLENEKFTPDCGVKISKVEYTIKVIKCIEHEDFVNKEFILRISCPNEVLELNLAKGSTYSFKVSLAHNTSDLILVDSSCKNLSK